MLCYKASVERKINLAEMSYTINAGVWQVTCFRTQHKLKEDFTSRNEIMTDLECAQIVYLCD
jgi:hypothetical protein